MIFGFFGVVKVLRRVYFGLFFRAGGPTEAGSAAFLGRGLLRQQGIWKVISGQSW